LTCILDKRSAARCQLEKRRQLKWKSFHKRMARNKITNLLPHALAAGVFVNDHFV
jgi:hypothetical protein